jgi:hypothetical protein
MGLFRKIVDSLGAFARREFCEEKRPGVIMGTRFRPMRPEAVVRVRGRK